MSLNGEIEIEYYLRHALVRQNCSYGSGWCGSRSVNMQFDMGIDTSVTAGIG